MARTSHQVSSGQKRRPGGSRYAITSRRHTVLKRHPGIPSPPPPPPLSCGDRGGAAGGGCACEAKLGCQDAVGAARGRVQGRVGAVHRTPASLPNGRLIRARKRSSGVSDLQEVSSNDANQRGTCGRVSALLSWACASRRPRESLKSSLVARAPLFPASAGAHPTDAASCTTGTLVKRFTPEKMGG